jgi:hypothetical protein
VLLKNRRLVAQKIGLQEPWATTRSGFRKVTFKVRLDLSSQWYRDLHGRSFEAPCRALTGSMAWVTMGEGLKAARCCIGRIAGGRSYGHTKPNAQCPMPGVHSLLLSLLNYVWSLSPHVSPRFQLPFPTEVKVSEYFSGTFFPEAEEDLSFCAISQFL